MRAPWRCALIEDRAAREEPPVRRPVLRRRPSAMDGARPSEIEPREPPDAARVRLRVLQRSDRDGFMELARESRSLHRPWTYPPERPEQFEELYARSRRDDFVCLVARLVETNEIAGVFTVSQIFRGAFQSAYLGYYANARFARQGYMSEALRQRS